MKIKRWLPEPTSQKGGFLPSEAVPGNGSSRREADIADRRGHRSWAEPPVRLRDCRRDGDAIPMLLMVPFGDQKGNTVQAKRPMPWLPPQL